MQDNRLEMAVVIVDFGMGSRVLKIAKQNGIPFGIVVLGKGTLKNRILEFLQLADIRKEIVIMASQQDVVENALAALDDYFNFSKPFHGIAFTMPLSEIAGADIRKISINDTHEGESVMKKAIIIIVDRGTAESAMEKAVKAGARGGTIVKARSSGDYEAAKLFHIDIEPEKEVLMILADDETAQSIIAAIQEHFKENGGDGLILCQNVNKTYGVS